MQVFPGSLMKVVCVGNDVVDLENPRTYGRATDERFVDRVFDAEEQEAIRAAADSDLELWSRWAAKEAGFKVISKLVGTPPLFVHRAFKVVWTSRDEPADEAVEAVIREGSVRFQDYEVGVYVALRTGGIHAVAFAIPEGRPEHVHVEPRVALLDSPTSRWAGSLEELVPRFTERELDAVYSRESAAVRVGARADLARDLRVNEDRLEIICAPGPTSQRPPRVLLDGQQAEADVSLSHDGQWIAWATWIGRDSR